MTIVSDVKSCAAGIKHAEAVFSKLALQTADEDASRLFHQCMEELQIVADSLQQRLYTLEKEEPEYQQ